MSGLTSDHLGKVVELYGNKAKVTFLRSEMCSHCGACHQTQNNEMETIVRNDAGAKVGDTVAVEIATGKVAKASLWAYVVPLMLLLAGVVIGGIWSELLGVIFGIVLCAGSYFILRLLNKGWTKNETYLAAITEIIHTEEEESENVERD